MIALRPLGLVWLTLLLAPCPTYAGNSTLKGELKLENVYVGTPADSLSKALGVGAHRDTTLKLRLMGSGRLGSGWSWDAAGVLELREGAGVRLDRRLYAYDPAQYTPPGRRNWLTLRRTFTNTGERYAAARIDRLSVAYSGAHAVVRLGRQALTWGVGLVFHPMDLFNPFSPDATDTEYKPGADMLYGQWLFDSGAELQGVVVPRRNPLTRAIEWRQSAGGLKWHGFLGAAQQYGYQLLIANDYGSDLLGLALNGSLGGASWSAETVPTRLRNGAWRASGLANLQYAWSCFARNCIGFAEYFHNGFGVGGSGNTLDNLPAALSERLARGELFTVSRDYLALGLTIEWSPLLNVKPVLIGNVNDGSALVLVQAVRSLSDNANLTVAVQSGFGPHGTEYGGMETAPGSRVYVTPQRYVYARLDWYF